MKENSIEEALKKLTTGKKMKMYELLRTFKREGIENFVITRKKYVDVILSDYKRVLKENEILKEEKEQAWEEWNNLEQGSYETEQKIKQQIKKLQKENEELKADNYELNNRINDLLDNISVQKVKDRIEKYKKLSDKFYVKFLESDRYNTDIREKGIKCDAIILELEELIEERKVK